MNNVRGVSRATREFIRERPVSVMASGMGAPSIGIYSYELYHFYDVETIIRVGSAGAISPKLHLRDVVMAQGACTDSYYAKQYGLREPLRPLRISRCWRRPWQRPAGWAWNRRWGICSLRMCSTVRTIIPWIGAGWVCWQWKWRRRPFTATPRKPDARALAICTISDSLVTGEKLSAPERQTSFRQMIEIALATAVAMDKR